jgi:hypothetical protein
MSEMRIWHLDEADLPEIAWPVRDVFMEKRERRPEPTVLPNDLKKSDRGRNENLHDYLTRKGIKCFCRKCVADRKREAMANNEKLL